MKRNIKNYNTNKVEYIPREKDKKIAKIQSFDVLHKEGYHFLADNHYILHGYRLYYSRLECFRSIFQLHNETLNVWTHLIGTIIFIFIFIFTIINNQNDKQLTVYEYNIPDWPIYVFLSSAIICLSFSAIFHLMFVYSHSYYIFLSRLDYAGIAIMITGSNYPIIYYAFYCDPTIRFIYLSLISIVGFITFIISLFPSFSSGKYLYIRTGVFVSLGLLGTVTLIHLITRFGYNDPHVTILITPLICMGLLYIIGALIYCSRFPERFYPGTFDIWLSSHQLWHLFVLSAALLHFGTTSQHLQWRGITKC